MGKRRERPKEFNPEQRALLDALAIAGGSMPVASLFGRVQPLAGPTALESLAAEASKLEGLGLLRHGVDSRGRFVCALTGAGWRAASVRRGRVRTTGAAMAIVCPVLVSCAATPARAPAPAEYGARPMPTLRVAQVPVGGRMVWSTCTQGCDQPTPKIRVFAVPLEDAGGSSRSPHANAGTVTPAASPPPPRDDPAGAPATAPLAAQPVAAQPSRASQSVPVEAPTGDQLMSSYSLFFASGRDAAYGADLGYVQAAASSAAEPDARVMVVGMTDKTGPASLNVDLAHRRAQHVRDLLVRAGVTQDRITMQADVSASRGLPANGWHRPGFSGNAMYRRVDVVVVWKRARQAG